MLKKSQRLSRKDLEKFFKGKFRSYGRGQLMLRVYWGDSGESPRFAFVVSSLIKRNAVARNLTRRRMAEISQELSPKIKGRTDLVFSFKLTGKTAPSFKSLKSDMIELLSICGAL
ncbi:MAG: ribonuclease P protein component [Patescibacteria group bacterium]